VLIFSRGHVKGRKEFFTEAATNLNKKNKSLVTPGGRNKHKGNSAPNEIDPLEDKKAGEAIEVLSKRTIVGKGFIIKAIFRRR